MYAQVSVFLRRERAWRWSTYSLTYVIVEVGQLDDIMRDEKSKAVSLRLLLCG